MADWPEVPLGDITTQRKSMAKVVPGRTYRTLGVRSKGLGPFEREAVTSDTTKATRLQRVENGDFIYNRLFAGTGSFGVVDESQAGCFVSNEFPVFTTDLGVVLPGFLRLYFQQPSVWDAVEAQCIGTTKSRNRWHEDKFRAMTVLLPTVDEQRRIVDLIDAVDRAAQKAEAAAEAAGALLRIHLDSLDATSARRLGDLANIGSGPSWKSDQEHPVPVDGGLPVIGITNTRPDGRLDLTDRRYVVGLSGKVRKLNSRSLIMIRTNGNRQRIGNIYRTTPDAVGSAVSAFQIAMEPTVEGISDFLFWVLRRPSTQRLISEAASGTTGLGNVAVKWLRELELPWPEDAERERYLGLAEALLRTQEAAEDGAAELRVLRSALLDDLLSGKQEIPSSYDALLESV